MDKLITLVIVVYEMRIIESPTIMSLVKISKNYNFNNVCVIIYDNSRKKQEEFSNLSFEFLYIHDETNGGLCAAYNYALQYSIENEIKWLMLLDQDTYLTLEYYEKAISTCQKLFYIDDVVCILPRTVTESYHLISPTKVSIWGWGQGIGDIVGTCSISITGINSGTLLRTSFMSLLGGFNIDFKLDMLDHWYFSEICRLGRKFHILNVTIVHSLSVAHYNSISKNRYISILESEVLFMRLLNSKKSLGVYMIRLLLRFFKQMIVLNNKEIAFLTLKSAFKVLKFLLCV